MSEILEPPTLPKMWDAYEIQPWNELSDGLLVATNVVAYEYKDGVWFFTDIDRVVTAVSMTAGGVYQLRPTE